MKLLFLELSNVTDEDIARMKSAVEAELKGTDTRVVVHRQHIAAIQMQQEAGEETLHVHNSRVTHAEAQKVAKMLGAVSEPGKSYTHKIADHMDFVLDKDTMADQKKLLQDMDKKGGVVIIPPKFHPPAPCPYSTQKKDEKAKASAWYYWVKTHGHPNPKDKLAVKAWLKAGQKMEDKPKDAKAMKSSKTVGKEPVSGGENPQEASGNLMQEQNVLEKVAQEGNMDIATLRAWHDFEQSHASNEVPVCDMCDAPCTGPATSLYRDRKFFHEKCYEGDE